MRVGDRLVGRANQKEPFRSGFAVIDARTGAVARHWVDRSSHDRSQCTFSRTRYGCVKTAWRLIDVTTGQARPFPYVAVWVSEDQLLAVHAGRMLTLRPDGTVGAIAEVDIPGAGEPISLGPPAWLAGLIPHGTIAADLSADGGRRP